MLSMANNAHSTILLYTINSACSTIQFSAVNNARSTILLSTANSGHSTILYLSTTVPTDLTIPSTLNIPPHTLLPQPEACSPHYLHSQQCPQALSSTIYSCPYRFATLPTLFVDSFNNPGSTVTSNNLLAIPSMAIF